MFRRRKHQKDPKKTSYDSSLPVSTPVTFNPALTPPEPSPTPTPTLPPSAPFASFESFTSAAAAAPPPAAAPPAPPPPQPSSQATSSTPSVSNDDAELVSRASSAPERSPSSEYSLQSFPQRAASERPPRQRNMSPAMLRELRKRSLKENTTPGVPLSPLASPPPIATPPPPSPNSDSRLQRKITSPAVVGYVPEELTSYSSPLRRRKALLIGISYRNNKYLDYLPGCCNDLVLMFELLTSTLFSFPADNVKVLSDELASIGGVQAEPATRINIVRYLKWLTDDVVRGDSVVFFFAGHGECVEDESGDEIDTGYDQCIMPQDYRPTPRHMTSAVQDKEVPPILDDIIYERLVRSVPAGAKVTAVVDACSSGTVCDLPVTYNPDSLPIFRNGETTPPRELIQLHKSAGGCVLFSGSADDQRALDITLKQDGRMQSYGIMTRSFVEAVREMVGARDGRTGYGVEAWSYGRLYERVKELVYDQSRRILPEGVEAQEPQLSTSHAISLWETAFTM